jgi:hypothetical protein
MYVDVDPCEPDCANALRARAGAANQQTQKPAQQRSGERGGLARAFGATWLSIRVGLTGKFGIGGGGDELLVVVVVRAVLVVVVVARRVAAVVALGATHLGGLLLVAARRFVDWKPSGTSVSLFCAICAASPCACPCCCASAVRAISFNMPARKSVGSSSSAIHSLFVLSRVWEPRNEKAFFSLFASRSRHSLSTRNTTISFIETHSPTLPHTLSHTCPATAAAPPHNAFVRDTSTTAFAVALASVIDRLFPPPSRHTNFSTTSIHTLTDAFDAIAIAHVPHAPAPRAAIAHRQRTPSCAPLYQTH